MPNSKIQFCVDNPYFCSPFHVWVDWKFPFLPRVGDDVTSWIWIKSEYCDLRKAKKELTSEGKEKLKKHKIERNGDFESFLYLYGCEHSKCVSSVSFCRKYEDDEIDVFIVLSERQNAHK